MVLRCFVLGPQAKKQARAAEAARREEERTAVKRAKEEGNATATRQIFDVRIFFDGLIFFQMIIDDTCCKYNCVMMLQDDASRPARSS